VREAAAGRRIDWIASGNNGTTYDPHEAAALQAGLEASPPSSSILGATGESFSSAMLRVLAAIFALERQKLPGAGPARPASAPVERVLVPTFAQGGANVAVVLERA
jgi:hypothetical protein